jgi:hypothetical protein
MLKSKDDMWDKRLVWLELSKVYKHTHTHTHTHANTPKQTQSHTQKTLTHLEL